MKVVIVAKTRQGSRACIGGLTFEGQSVRLLAADAAVNTHANQDYQVGEVWDVSGAPAEQIVPPHVENFVVHARRRLGVISDCVALIQRHLPIADGSWQQLYDGLLQPTPTGALFIAARTGVPSFSTTFWRPDQPLTRAEDGKRIRYRYQTSTGACTLVFVGFQEPLETLPAGALLRVSLAHWWRPPQDADMELRCYAQLSGWFLPPPPPPSLDALPAQFPAPALPYVLGPQAPPPGQTDSAVRLAPVPPPPGQPDGSPGSAQEVLKAVFGYDSFRQLQPEIIASVLTGRDALAVMPTGSGKSLCYQLPALLLDGLTVVVSPLISLMQDQVMQLRDLGAPAAFLNSALSYSDYLNVTTQVRSGALKLLYTSPETLLRPETLLLLDKARVRCLAIDEAHCISEWGHDFRPEYRQLLPVRRRFADAVCLALTATATERVRRDIQERLGFQEANAFVASFDRPNLLLTVQPRVGGFGQVISFLQGRREQAGIVYCSTRKEVERLAEFLTTHGWPALPYHAGMDNDTRRHNQEQFSRDRAPLIVATIAFGMGINKSNVRFVVHYNLPKDLESYYQEIGRAGRDGLQADCLLLYNRQDLVFLNRLIEEGAPSERAGRQARLQAMVRYAETQACRRQLLLAYFGEQMEACGFCDTCLSDHDAQALTDVTGAAVNFLDSVRRTGEMFGAGHLIEILRGSRNLRVLARQHERLPTHGAGKEFIQAQWRRLAEAFIRQGLVDQDMTHGGLRLTDAGRAVLDGARVDIPAADLQEPGAGPILLTAPQHDTALFERLRALRRDLAEAADLPPYVVFSDRTLSEMATYYPQSSAALLTIHGVGQRKLATYGAQFLEAIVAYCAPRGLAARGRPPDAPTGAEPRRRWQEVGDAFAAGASLLELMALYGVKQNTIVGHLYTYAGAGGSLDSARVRALSQLPPDLQEQVLTHFQTLGNERLSPVFDALGGAVSYDELHVLRLYNALTRRNP